MRCHEHFWLGQAMSCKSFFFILPSLETECITADVNGDHKSSFTSPWPTTFTIQELISLLFGEISRDQRITNNSGIYSTSSLVHVAGDRVEYFHKSACYWGHSVVLPHKCVLLRTEWSTSTFVRVAEVIVKYFHTSACYRGHSEVLPH